MLQDAAGFFPLIFSLDFFFFFFFALGPHPPPDILLLLKIHIVFSNDCFEI